MAANTESQTMVDQPRENMISTAITFLQNPKVRESPFTQRRKFLEKKGLIKEEIDIAIERSGTAADEHVTVPSDSPVVAKSQSMVYVPPPVSKWQGVRDTLSSAIVAGGLSYGIYIFFKRFIAPHWFGPNRQEQQLAALKSSVIQVQASLKEMITHLQETNTTLRSQQENMIATVNQSTGGARHEDIFCEIKEQISTIKCHDSMSDIKQEIKSLKSLLLSRNQFPQTPATKPVIPTWQLTSASAKDPDKENSIQNANILLDLKAEDTRESTYNMEDMKAVTIQRPDTPIEASTQFTASNFKEVSDLNCDLKNETNDEDSIGKG